MSCQKGPIHHACAWQIGPFWQATLDICFSALIIHCFRQWIVSYIVPISFWIDSDPILIWCLSWIIKYWKGHWEYRFDSICMMLMNRFTREKIISLQLYITCKCHMMMKFYDLHPISNYQQGPWWHNEMETFFASLPFCEGNLLATGGFHSQMPVTQSFDVFFDLCLNKHLNKQSRRWWFETPSSSLWH